MKFSFQSSDGKTVYNCSSVTPEMKARLMAKAGNDAGETGGRGSLIFRKPEVKIMVSLACICLLLAVAEFPAIWPYQLSRWGICAGAAWCAWKSIRWRRSLLVVLAVVYNPIQPIHFGEDWPGVNIISCAGFLSVIFVKKVRLNWRLIGVRAAAVIMTTFAVLVAVAAWRDAVSGTPRLSRAEKNQQEAQKRLDADIRKLFPMEVPPMVRLNPTFEPIPLMDAKPKAVYSLTQEDALILERDMINLSPEDQALAKMKLSEFYLNKSRQ